MTIHQCCGPCRFIVLVRLSKRILLCPEWWSRRKRANWPRPVRFCSVIVITFDLDAPPPRIPLVLAHLSCYLRTTRAILPSPLTTHGCQYNHLFARFLGDLSFKCVFVVQVTIWLISNALSVVSNYCILKGMPRQRSTTFPIREYLAPNRSPFSEICGACGERYDIIMTTTFSVINNLHFYSRFYQNMTWTW